MIRVSRMYFQEGLSRVEIARRLRLSRFQVARILDEGREEGFVKVQILEPEPYHTELASELELRFGLRVAVLVDDDDLPSDELRVRVGTAAGRYLLEILRDEDVLGISLGSTVQAVVDSLPNRISADVSVVQLIGGGVDSERAASCDVLTWKLAQKLGTLPAFLFAPVLVDAVEAKDMLLAESRIQATYSQFKSLTVAVVGIGALGDAPSSSLVRTGIFDSDRLQSMTALGAVGDILVYAYDRHGQVIRSGLEERSLAVPLDDFLNTPHRIGVASGREKADALLGALRGGFVNVLVTDHLTAQELVLREKHPLGQTGV